VIRIHFATSQLENWKKIIISATKFLVNFLILWGATRFEEEEDSSPISLSLW
jgi:hypothetical protein